MTAHLIPTKALSQHDKLVKQSRKLVSQTFFGTMLRQMRNSPFKSQIFDGGRGGEAFSEMLDQHLADRMANGKVANKLVNALVNRIEANAEAKARKAGIKAPTKPHPKSPGQALFEKSSYFKRNQSVGRKNVAADIRA